MLSVSGCRGIVGQSLTPEVVARFAGAFAQWIICSGGGGTSGGGGAITSATAQPIVVVGRDGRLGGDVVAQIAIGALRAAGCRVIDLGVAMTATVGLMVVERSSGGSGGGGSGGSASGGGGLVITASHNPAEWNGLKPITSRGKAPSAAESAALLALYYEDSIALAPVNRLGPVETESGAGRAHALRVIEVLGEMASLEVLRARRFNIVVDSVNSSGAEGADALLSGLGCSVHNVAADGSGVFPHPPEPIAEHLGSLCDAVRARAADIGFAQDPDGDRLAIVDEQGRFIGEEYTLALAAEAFFTLRQGGAGVCLAANLSTSRMIDDVAQRHGARIVRTPVGEANVVDAMLREHSALGGEGNGGVILPDVVLIRDSLSAMALILALMARESAPISAVVDRLPRYSIIKRKAPVREGLAQRAVEAIAARWQRERTDRQDGVRIDFESNPLRRAWLHVRASNTEPIIRLIAEAPTPETAHALLNEAETTIRAL